MIVKLSLGTSVERNSENKIKAKRYTGKSGEGALIN